MANPISITFKTKPFVMYDQNDQKRLAITFKKRLKRGDCSAKPTDHQYYNSDLFEAMLNRAYRRIIGEHKEWAWVDEMPAGVSIDTSKFLATVTIELPANFR